MRTVNMMPLPREMPGSRRSIRAERAPRRLPGRIRRPGSRAGPAKAARGASAGAHPQREVDAGNLVALPEVTDVARSEEHTSELQSLAYIVCRLLLEKQK